MKKIVTGLILGLMCLAGAAVSHAETKYAVCVGINTYSLSGAGDLTGCVNDAAYFYTNLVERGGWSTANMTKLLNSGAKKSAIRKAISNCAAKAVSGDTFVYQHSSHGGQNSGRSVFLCAYDDYYEDTEVAADLRSFAAGVKVVVVVDACHSGGLFQGDSGKAKRAASEFDLAGRVTELMEADRARRAARGEAVEKSLSAKEIGWVTAANYTESSLDGGFYESDEWLTNPTYGDDDYNESTGTYPSSYKLGGVFLGSFTWSWWNGACDTNSLGDGDGYADAYECWKDAYDFCTKIDKFWDVSGYSFTPQCTNTAVLRSVELGWAGKEEPSGFRFAKLPDLDATVGSPVSCTLSATNTDGSAVSVSYAVSSATAPAAAYSIAGNVFTFTPAADGSFSFSFTATDALTGNTAKGTLTVDAALAAPTGLANSGVTATSFTANWGAVAGAASYLLDVASAPFAAKGASRADGDVLLSEDFAAFSGTAADRSSTLDTYLAGTGWTGSKVFENGGSAKLGSGSFNGWIATPALDLSSGGAVAFDLTQYGNGDGNTVSVSILSGGDETEIGTATPGETATVEFAIPAASEATSVKISTSAKRAIIDNLVVTGGSSADILPAQEVTGTSFAVEGLATDTYYWRVRAVGNAKGPFSETMDVTLVADPTAPPSIRPIANIEIEVGEIATAEVRVTTPEKAPLTAGPEITAGDAAATLEGGVFSFAPAAPGTYEFTITAANANDSASISFAVTATLAEPETPEVPAVVGSEGFTAEWTAIPGAESYELVVIEGKGGSSGGGGSGETLTETFAKATFSSTGSSYSSQTITGGDLGTWTATECRGDADAPIVRGTGTLTSPEIVGGVSAVEFDYSWPFSDSGTCPFDLVVNGSKVSSASVTAEKGSSGTVAFGAFSAVSGASTVQFVNNGAASKMRMCFDEIRITTASAKSISRAVGDVVYSNNVGNVTRFEVTGLQPSTEYTFSFRAIAGDETTDWSEPVSVTTSEGPSAPVWTAIPAQNTYAGATFQLDLSAYLSGSPTPTVTADVGTVTGLHYVYEPEATGSVTVTLTASNDSGTQQTSFVLSVAEPPVGGNHYAVVVGCNKYDTEYVPSDNFLNGCVPDANHVHELITSRGEWEAANVTKLTDSSAKHSAVLSAIAAAAAKAVPGDTFLYFHSSHGGNYTYTFVTNTALYTDWPIMVYSVDPEGVDNCICTYDADFTAAELASALAAFDPAVNIVVMIDACHSAGMFQYTGTPVSQRIVRRNAAGKAMRSADASVFAEAVSAQIGAIRRARGIRAASNVAFVTAANFDEYSYDSQSGDGGEFTSAFIEGVTNGACDGADYGDQDGWATFYEGWNYAKDIAVGMAEGTEVDYEGHTVDANGYALYDNAYYAEEYDEPAYYYDYYFTHAQIDNEPLLRVVRVGYAGNPTLAAPVANPAADVTASSFTASWSAVADATSYRLQVATDESFSTGASSDALTAADLAATGSNYTEFSGVAKGSGAVYAGKTAKSSGGAIQLNAKTSTGAGIWTTASGGTATRIAVEWSSETGASRSLQIYGSTTALDSYAAVKAATLAGTIAYGSATAVDLEGSYPYVGILAVGGAVYLDSVSVDWGTAGSESSIVLDQDVGNVTSYEVTGLEAETDYFYRVQALGDPVDSDFSNVISLTTESGTPYAPVWSVIPEQSAVAGEMFEFDAADYVKASPAATITLVSSTAADGDYEFEDGYLIFTPPAEGSYEFEFQAANSLDVANATMTVVAAAAPVTVPTLALSNPQATSFDASWTVCTGVSSYQLQVATDDQFTSGGGGGGDVLTETFASAAFSTTSSSYTDQTITGCDLGTWTATSCRGDSTAPIVRYAGTLTSPSLEGGVAAVEFDYEWPYKESGTCDIDLYVNGTKADSATVTGGEAGTASYSAFAPVSGTVTIEFLNTGTSNKRMKITEVRITSASKSVAKDGGSIVLDMIVEGTSKTVDGLEPETLYYARVKGAAEWSAVESIKTQADVPSAPEWKEIPEQTAIVGQEFVLDLSGYVTGSPFPTITVDGTVAEGGSWSFTPDGATTYTFELVASNTEGSDSTTLTVVAEEAPAAKYALCVGLNEYDYKAWEEQGWGIDALHGCVNDATYMKKNLTERGGWAEADVTLLTDAAATKDALRGAIAAAAAKAKAGDTFVYQHSSHGLNNKDLESDEYTKNVALATYAAPYEDFELAEDLAAFADGVKVVIAIDACHSSGMFKKGAAKAGSFDIAVRVSALMDANRTARKARGEDVSRNLTSDQVGWVTAADFDESSKDGGYYDTDEWMLDEDAEGEESGGTFLSSFTWGWWTGKADVSGEGDGDGWFDAYEGWGFASPVCLDEGFTPQFLNEDVLRSVELGYAGETAPSEAIVFDPVPGATVGIGEEAMLTVVAKNADGTTDGITLSIVEAPEGADYAFENGTLTFTPEEDGLFLFTVQAVKGRTSATKLLGVTAVLPAPVALAATDVADDGFTANWTGVDAAQGYQLQVSLSDSFPAVEGDEIIEEGFDGVTDKDTLPEDWTFEGGAFGVYTGKGYYGEAAPAIKISTKGTNILASPTFKVDRAMNGLAFWTMCNSTNPTSTVTVELLVGGEWKELDSFVPSPDGETKEYENFDPSATQVRFVVDRVTGNVAIDDVKVVQAKGDMVLDEKEIDGGETSFAVEGLKSGTTYYYRVRAIGNSKSAWSEVKEVTTSGEVAIPVPELTVGTSETNPDTAIYAIWLCDGVSKIQLQVASDAEFGAEFLVYDEEVSDLVGVVSGLTPETTYYVRARALVGERAGEWSEAQSVTTAAGGGEPEEPVIGGEEMADFELASVDSVTGRKSIKATATGKLATDYTSVKLEWAVKVVDGAWDFDQHEAIGNNADYPEIDFDYPEGDFAIMRFVFE